MIELIICLTFHSKKGKRAGLNGQKEVLALVLSVLKLVLLMLTQAVLAVLALVLALAFRV